MSPPPRRRRIGHWLCVAHVVVVISLAASNVLLALSLLLLPWTVGWRRLRRHLTEPALRRLLVPLGVMLLLLGISVLASYEVRTSLGAHTDLFALLSLVLTLVFIRGEGQVRRVFTGLVGLGSVLALLGLGEYLVGTGGLDLSQRIRGPLSHYQTFAGLLLLCDLILIVNLVLDPRWRRAWHWLALVGINLALLGSLTRGPWVGLAVAVTLLVVIRAPRYLIAFAPAALLFFLFAPGPVVERALSIGNLRDTSNYDRLCMAYAGGLMIAERPLFGIGPGLVESRYPIYRHPTAPRLQVPHLHNALVQLAAERGLLSLAAYLWLFGASVRWSWQSFRGEGGVSGSRSGLSLASLLALVAFNVAAVFEDNWSDREVQRVVLFLLAVPACLRPAGEEADAEATLS